MGGEGRATPFSKFFNFGVMSLKFYGLQESALCSISYSPHMPYAFTGQQKQFRTTHTSNGDGPSQRPAKPGSPQWFSESSSQSQQVAGIKVLKHVKISCLGVKRFRGKNEQNDKIRQIEICQALNWHELAMVDTIHNTNTPIVCATPTSTGPSFPKAKPRP